MKVLEGNGGLIEDAGRLLGGEVALAADVPEEVAFAGVLEEEVDLGFDLEVVVKLDDVGVLHFPVALDLPLQVFDVSLEVVAG